MIIILACIILSAICVFIEFFTMKHIFKKHWFYIGFVYGIVAMNIVFIIADLFLKK